jgi:hypothetical protein
MMYESDDIIQYLFTTYGDGQVPLPLRLGMLTTITCALGSLSRCEAGVLPCVSKRGYLSVFAYLFPYVYVSLHP